MIKQILSVPLKISDVFLNNLKLFFRSITHALESPIEPNFSSLANLAKAFLASFVAIAVFVLVRPFGFEEFQVDSKWLLLIAVCFIGGIGYLFATLVLPLLLKSYYNKESWTVFKAIMGNTISSFFGALALMIVSNTIGIMQFELPQMLVLFSGVVFLLSFFYNVVKANFLAKRNARIAMEFNRELQESTIISNKETAFPMLKIVGSNDCINILPNQLVRAEFSKYSGEFLYMNFFGVVSKKLDLVPKNCVDEIMEFEQFVRLDKKLLVNKNAILSAKGDSAGLRLNIAKTDKEIRIKKSSLKRILAC